MHHPIFHRQEFTASLVNRLLNPSPLETTVRDGLFIFGDREVGKTTFLTQDLMPALENAGALVIYANLLENPESLPSYKVALKAVHKRLHELVYGDVFQNTSSAYFGNFNISFDPDKVGLRSGVSLANAFLELAINIPCSIVFIIDEIQEAVQSESGKHLLVSLKKAKDAVNSRANNTNNNYLLIVGTGSHPSFEYILLSHSHHPFLHSDALNFPKLGQEFIEWIKSLSSPKHKLPDESVMLECFNMLNARPKTFLELLDKIQSCSENDFNKSFLSICTQKAESEINEIIEDIASSDILTKIIFTEIAEAGPEGRDLILSQEYYTYLDNLLKHRFLFLPSILPEILQDMIDSNWIGATRRGHYVIINSRVRERWLSKSNEYLKL